MATDREINPMGNLYDSFLKIINGVTIKYSYEAQLHETAESKRNADNYITALDKKDDFFYYNDYTDTEIDYAYSAAYSNVYQRVAYSDEILKVKDGQYREASKPVQDILLKIRRERTIRDFEETNDYYRTLNGYPLTSDPLSQVKKDINLITKDGDPSYAQRIKSERNYEYVTEKLAKKYNIEEVTNMPLYRVEDTLNNSGAPANFGSYAISALEGSLVIEKAKEKAANTVATLRKGDITDKQNADIIENQSKYLNYLGSNRISIKVARKAKNFEIISVKEIDVKQNVLDAFLTIYAQCRDYFTKVIYVPRYNDFFDYYDNFIGMCIMIMTMQQIVSRQIFSTTDRNFFDIEGVRALYEAYNIPFDLNIDEATQNQILRNVNMLIQKKATDKVLYNIADLLGFSNIKIYKYFLSKQQKYDMFGAPIIAYKNYFDEKTGEVKTVPDTDKMYDIYFHRVDLTSKNFNASFADKNNKVIYDEATSGDPFWWNDTNTLNRIWTTEYNFVESKYLSLGVSYSMSEVIFENVLLLKMILQKKDYFKNITVKLPRIMPDVDVPLSDVIVLLICLTAAAHHLYGEIVTLPTQVMSVLDYIRNKNGDFTLTPVDIREYVKDPETKNGKYHNRVNNDFNLDTLEFNINYLFNYHDYEDIKREAYLKQGISKEEIDKNLRHDNDKFMTKMQDTLKNHMADMNKEEENKVYTTFGLNFNYFPKDDVAKRTAMLNELEDAFAKYGDTQHDDFETFKRFVDYMSNESGTTVKDRVKALNLLYSSAKNVYWILRYYMNKTDDRSIYELLKRTNDALFYSKEVTEAFTINTNTKQRTAYTYFEYLYYINPKLYNKIFYINFEEEYNKYIKKNKLRAKDYSYEQFQSDVDEGNVFIDYSTLKVEKNASTVNTRADAIYIYITHIIGRLESLIKNVRFMYLLVDTSTPLEELLLKLIKFFKSYTVDVMGIDTIFICDFKPELTLRLFDEPYYLYKVIETPEHYHVSHDDVIRSLTGLLYAGVPLYILDKLYYTIILRFCKGDVYTTLGWIRKYWYTANMNVDEYAPARLYDFPYIRSLINGLNKIKLKDMYEYESHDYTNDNMKFKESIITYFSD